jgi:hypothetical protein
MGAEVWEVLQYACISEIVVTSRTTSVFILTVKLYDDYGPSAFIMGKRNRSVRKPMHIRDKFAMLSNLLKRETFVFTLIRFRYQFQRYRARLTGEGTTRLFIYLCYWPVLCLRITTDLMSGTVFFPHDPVLKHTFLSFLQVLISHLILNEISCSVRDHTRHALSGKSVSNELIPCRHS